LYIIAPEFAGIEEAKEISYIISKKRILLREYAGGGGDLESENTIKV